MKYLSLLAFTFFLNSASAQEYSFQLYTKYPCDSIAKPSKILYHLLNPANYEIYDMTADSMRKLTYEPIPLPGPGTYRIGSMELTEMKDIEVVIDKPGITKYELNLPKINIHAVGLSLFPEYRSCNIVCNGYHEDRYSNGNFRIKGYFSNGVPFKLKEYYSNGIMESKFYKSLYKNHRVEYDSIGKLKKKYWSKRGGFYLSYKDYGYTIYNPNQNILIKKSTIKHIDRVKIFYPNGNLKIKVSKNKRVEYYENGQLKTAYKWKTITERSYFGNKKQLYDIYKSNYDEKGKLINIEERTESVADNPQPSIAFPENDSDYYN
jgi:hypothetical protein